MVNKAYCDICGGEIHGIATVGSIILSGLIMGEDYNQICVPCQRKIRKLIQKLKKEISENE